jgi:small-conductance mechanosensitive channel
VLSDPPVSVHLTEFGADGLVLTVNFWIADPENGTGLVRSEVNLAILGVLNRAGIDIPYPQRVVRQIAAAD